MSGPPQPALATSSHERFWEPGRSASRALLHASRIVSDTSRRDVVPGESPGHGLILREADLTPYRVA
jgi:hypothetical protein